MGILISKGSYEDKKLRGEVLNAYDLLLVHPHQEQMPGDTVRVSGHMVERALDDGYGWPGGKTPTDAEPPQSADVETTGDLAFAPKLTTTSELAAAEEKAARPKKASAKKSPAPMRSVVVAEPVNDLSDERFHDLNPRVGKPPAKMAGKASKGKK